MDNLKIGSFIAACRHDHGLSQKELAEQLCVSDKTVSKWETGRGLPDVSIMLSLCGELDISVNELLAGERLSDETYKQKAEENIMDLIREKRDSKKKIAVSAAAAITGVAVMVMSILVAAYWTELDTPLKVLIVAVGVAVFAVDLVIATALDLDAGSYECKYCHARFVPSAKSYLMGAHTILRRRLKCPHCGKSGYFRRRLTKSK